MDLKSSTIIEALEMAVSHFPEKIAYTFLQDEQETAFTYREVVLKAKAIASSISSRVSPGDRVLLMYPDGKEFVPALFGCLYAGAIAVPVYPPQHSHESGVYYQIIKDVEPSLCLSTKVVLDEAKAMFGDDMVWLLTDDDAEMDKSHGIYSFNVMPESIAMLHYTSGSKGENRPNVLTHSHIIHNLEMHRIDAHINENDSICSFLNPSHGMGFFSAILLPIYCQIPFYLMSYDAFLERPARWLKAITKHHITISLAPNYAYQLCWETISDDEKETLDLSSWEVAFISGELVKPALLDGFYQTFRSCGFRKEIFHPEYWISESTGYVLGSRRNHGAALCYVDLEALKHNQINQVLSKSEGSCPLVTYFNNVLFQEVKIVNPNTSVECGDGEIGEIWLRGPCVAPGYWQQAEATQSIFHNILNGQGPYLRTGDMGCVQGGLVIILARQKELISIHGKNYIPQLVEFELRCCHSDIIRGNNVVVFSVKRIDKDELIIVAEVKDISDDRAKAVFSTIQKCASEHIDEPIHAILLVPKDTIGKTGEGKICREEIREDYLAHRVKFTHQWSGDGMLDLVSSLSLPLQAKEEPVDAELNQDIEQEEDVEPIYEVQRESLEPHSDPLVFDSNVSEQDDLIAEPIFEVAMDSDEPNEFPVSFNEETLEEERTLRVHDESVNPTYNMPLEDIESEQVAEGSSISFSGEEMPVDSSSSWESEEISIRDDVQAEELNVHPEEVATESLEHGVPDEAEIYPLVDTEFNEEMVASLSEHDYDSVAPTVSEEPPAVAPEPMIFEPQPVVFEPLVTPELPITLKEPLSNAYRLVWRLQEEITKPQPIDYLPDGERFKQKLTQGFSSLATSFSDYPQFENEMNQLALSYFNQAVSDLGGDVQADDSAWSNWLKKSQVVKSNYALMNQLRRLLGKEHAVGDISLEQASLIANYPLYEQEINNFVRCAEKMPEILRGEKASSYPSYDTVTLAYYETLTTTLKSILEKWPRNNPLRILEIGGHDKGLTEALLNGLKEYPIHYVYSHASKDALDSAKARYHEYDFVDFQSINLEQDLSEQGIGLQQYSVVIASHLSQSSKNITYSLQNLHQLLCADGALILLENTRKPAWSTLSEGLLEENWSPENCYDKEQWLSLLDIHGFTESCVYTDSLSQAPQAIVFAKTMTMPVQQEADQWLIFTDAQSNHLTLALISQLKGAGKGAVRVEIGEQFSVESPHQCFINPDNSEDFKQLFTYMAGKKVAGIIYLWPISKGYKFEDEGLKYTHVYVNTLIQEMNAAHLMAKLFLVTQGVHQINLEVPKGFHQAFVSGIVNQVAKVYPDLSLAEVDLDLTYLPDEAAYMLFQQLWKLPFEQHICLRQYARYVSRIAAFDIPVSKEMSINQEATYVITGALGHLGFALAEWLVRLQVKHLLLIDAISADDARIESLKQSGTEVMLHCIDVADSKALSLLLQEAEKTLPPIASIMHIANTFDEKVYGSWHLHQLTHHYPLDHFVLFTSLASLSGSLSDSEFASAEAYQNALTDYRHALGLSALCVNWAVEETKAGINSFTLDEGLNALSNLWQQKEQIQVYFAHFDWHALAPSLGNQRVFADFVSMNDTTTTTWLTRLQRADARKKLSLIKQELRFCAATVTKEPIDSFQDDTKGFVAMGMSSMKAVAFRQLLQTSFNNQLTLPVTMIYEYPTIDALSHYLLAQVNTLGVESPVNNSLSEESTKAIAKEGDIAIIGFSCRTPGGVDSPASLWQLLMDKQDVIKDMPSAREGAAQQKGGFVENIDRFDSSFFNLSRDESRYLDPQHRLLLEASWEALESSGISPTSLAKSDTGVYIGISSQDYLNVMRESATPLDNPLISMGNAHSMAAGRIAYFLGLQGPCLSIDTDCSSSLTALHLAVQGLRRKECHVALSGGVNVLLLAAGDASGKPNLLSEDGQCRSFDAAANGFVQSEGCGMFVLKRYEDALKDQDNICAIIKGSAMNQDGASAGFTIPNLSSQQSVIQKSLEDAALKPQDIDYVEGHGTGTLMGDLIEMNALSVLASGRQKPLLLGSIKSNLGHAEAASGALGVMKVVLSLAYDSIPGNLHFETINPDVNLKNIPLEIVKEPIAWTRKEDGVRRAGVSSFGFSGTNVHMVLEEPPVASNSSEEITLSHYLITLSAKSKQALGALVDSYTAFLPTTNLTLAEIAYTANAGRSHLTYRLAVIADSIETLQTKLLNKSYELSVCQQQQDALIDAQAAGLVDKISENNLDDLQALAHLYLQGATIPWHQLPESLKRKKVLIPTYRFQRQSYWFNAVNEAIPSVYDDFWSDELELNPSIGVAKWLPEQSIQTAKEVTTEWHSPLFYQWKCQKEALTSPSPDKVAQTWLVFTDDNGVIDALQRWLSAHEIQLIQACTGRDYNPASKRDIITYMAEQPHPDKIIYWPSTHHTVDPSVIEFNTLKFMIFLQAMPEAYHEDKPSLSLITMGAIPLETKAVSLEQSCLTGLFKSFMLGQPDWFCQQIDLDPNDLLLDNTQRVSEELLGRAEDFQTVYRQHQRHVMRLMRQPLAQQTRALTLNPEGSYLVVGDSHGVGLQLVQWLVNQGAKHLVLVDENKPSESTESLVQMLREEAVIELVVADISDKKAADDVIAHFNKQWPYLCGIIHANDQSYDLGASHAFKGFKQLFRPSVYGAWHLHESCLEHHIDLDFFVMFSSLAPTFGSVEHINDSTAYAFYDNLASYRHQMGLAALSIHWGDWALRGVADEMMASYEAKGIVPLVEADVLMAMSKAIMSHQAKLIIANIDWGRWMKESVNKSAWLQAFIESDNLVQHHEEIIQDPLDQEIDEASLSGSLEELILHKNS